MRKTDVWKYPRCSKIRIQLSAIFMAYIDLTRLYAALVNGWMSKRPGWSHKSKEKKGETERKIFDDHRSPADTGQTISHLALHQRATDTRRERYEDLKEETGKSSPRGISSVVTLFPALRSSSVQIGTETEARISRFSRGFLLITLIWLHNAISVGK